MPRILPRGEIEGLDHTRIPRVRLPDLSDLFSARAARLRQLATDNPLQDYLRFMAIVCDAQQDAAARLGAAVALPDAGALATAQAHGMPPIPATGWARAPLWRDGLAQILDTLANGQGVPAPAAQVCVDLLAQLDADPEALEAGADAILARLQTVDVEAAPFIMAGLQVYWSALAAALPEAALPVVLPFGVCPVCGSLPVASIVRVGGAADGCRYLCCPLCATERHLVRVTCSHCEQTGKIAYHFIDGGLDGIQAESCDDCNSYRKIFHQSKQLMVDAVADDLASLALDVLMGDAGYSRASDNPLLWHAEQD